MNSDLTLKFRLDVEVGLMLNKPIYAGFSILELSKVHMMNFHYNFIYEKYGNKAKLLFSDTDSLTYHIETHDLYQDMFDNKDLFDFSDYKKNSPFYDETNKKVIGKFKDESLGIPIKEFVGLRAKCYSVLHDNDKQKNTAKGVTQSAKKDKLNHQEYLDVLFNEEKKPVIHEQRGFRTKNHEVFTVESKKVCLSRFDNKRWILPDSYTTRAYGHYLNEAN